MAGENDFRIIGLDRPGIGLSSPHLYESILDFVPDLELLLDHLDVGRFAVVGLSGGGPYALATAFALPDRVTAAAILGGVVPNVGEDSMEGGVVGYLSRFRSALPWVSAPLSRLVQGLIVAVGPLGPQALGLYGHFAPEGDRIVLARPDIKAMFLDDLIKNSRRGMGAALNDLALFFRPWGFSVTEITVPVRWWHGDADNFVPLDHACQLIACIPNAQLYERPGESHLGGLGAAKEVIDVLLKIGL
jgi:pimeloyl-ACP methyl ester carboxylesterase